MVRMSALKPLPWMPPALAEVPPPRPRRFSVSWFGPPVADFNKNGVFSGEKEVARLRRGGCV